ncbi:TPA: peptidylprolyl isomerase [Candidatus Scatousia excrementigallinarum]|uniref:peptidylprolyl isomerase n=1 Tax=Candidatus Scatousia excrementigallinarum TaxID=2840935 RepID=A0A9D1EYM1_9BACT|nr:peptidylprolyl isomerase [Candidatus Scatousia excrementigallinarum]
MKGKKLLATVALSALLFTGCGIKSAQTIIKVNGQNITQGQFDESFNKSTQGGMMAQLGINVKDGKNGFLYYLIKDKVVNELIVKELLNQEIEKRGIKVSNEDVDNAIKEIVDKVGSKEQLNQILKQNGVSTSQFKKDLAEEVKMKKLAKELTDSNVSDADAKKYYNENIKQFKYPDKVRASHILISVNPQEIEEIITSDKENAGASKEEIKKKVDAEIANKKAKAEKVLAEAKKDPSQFEKLAKENSDDTTTAVKGGDLGFFAAQEMVPEFSKAAFSMKPNTISNLVQTQFGYHIIMVTDRMAAGQQPFEKVKNDIKGFLETQKQLQAIDKLVESLKKNATIEYVNKEYDPKVIQQSLQTEIKQSGEKAKEIKDSAAKKEEAKK